VTLCIDALLGGKYNPENLDFEPQFEARVTVGQFRVNTHLSMTWITIYFWFLAEGGCRVDDQPHFLSLFIQKYTVRTSEASP
jgi:hypothetical protein